MMNVLVRVALVLLLTGTVLGCGSREASDEDSANMVVAEHPLHEAIRSGDLDKVKELLASDPEALHRGDGALGETPLHQAAASDEVEIAEFLIESGADVNAMDNRRVTPLTTAIDADASAEMIDLIKAHGGDD